MSPKGAFHHPDVGADRQQAPQSQGKGKPSTTTAPAAKGRHWDMQTVLLQERYHTGTTPPGWWKIFNKNNNQLLPLGYKNS